RGEAPQPGRPPLELDLLDVRLLIHARVHTKCPHRTLRVDYRGDASIAVLPGDSSTRQSYSDVVRRVVRHDCVLESTEEQRSGAGHRRHRRGLARTMPPRPSGKFPAKATCPKELMSWLYKGNSNGGPKQHA